MGDALDNAQRASEVYRDAALRSHLAHRQTKLPLSINCIDCEKTIPEARRKANPEAKRCLPCQEKSERGGGLDE